VPARRALVYVRYLSYPVVLVNYCCFIFHCASSFCCFCCCPCFSMDISLTPCFLVAAYGQLHPPPATPRQIHVCRVVTSATSVMKYMRCNVRTSCARVSPALVSCFPGDTNFNIITHFLLIRRLNYLLHSATVRVLRLINSKF
jgi:hypothetical protein